MKAFFHMAFFLLICAVKGRSKVNTEIVISLCEQEQPSELALSMRHHHLELAQNECSLSLVLMSYFTVVEHLHPYTNLEKESNSLLFQHAIKCPLKNPFISNGIEIAACEKKNVSSSG